MIISCVAALALAMTTFAAPQARAAWVGVGVGVGVYGGPAYYGPAAAVTVAAPYYYAPRLAFAAPYPYFHPYGRFGYGWGHRHFYGGRYYRR